MPTATMLATLLDQEMLSSRGIVIAPSDTSIPELPVCTGSDVYERHLGKRLLLRYIMRKQYDEFLHGSSRSHFVTTTPYPADEAVSSLALPQPTPRRYVLILDPREIARIAGPRWVRFGTGIEYFLPDGFPRRALLAGWPIPVR